MFVYNRRSPSLFSLCLWVPPLFCHNLFVYRHSLTVRVLPIRYFPIICLFIVGVTQIRGRLDQLVYPISHASIFLSLFHPSFAFFSALPLALFVCSWPVSINPTPHGRWGPDFIRGSRDNVPDLLRILQDLVDIRSLRNVRVFYILPVRYEGLLGEVRPAKKSGE